MLDTHVIIIYSCVGTPCDSNPCNCSYLKPYHELLSIPCFDENNNCSWFHNISNVLKPVRDYIVTASGITLPGNFDPESYGTFISNFSNSSCRYLVIPEEGMYMLYMNIYACSYVCICAMYIQYVYM